MTKSIITIFLLLLHLSCNYKTEELSVEETGFISGTDALAQRRSINETKLLGEQITQALIQIESLTLSREIFDNEIFQSLDDKSRNIQPEPAGRRNPFAPLSDTSVNYTVENSFTNPDNDDTSSDSSGGSSTSGSSAGDSGSSDNSDTSSDSSSATPPSSGSGASSGISSVTYP